MTAPGLIGEPGTFIGLPAAPSPDLYPWIGGPIGYIMNGEYWGTPMGEPEAVCSELELLLELALAKP